MNRKRVTSESTPLLDYSQGARIPVRNKSVILVIAENKIICFLYLCFLLWQLAGDTLVFIKIVQCCLREKHSTLECRNFTAFEYSQDIEFAATISRSTGNWLFLFVLIKTPQFLGWGIVLKKLVYLPSFWTLQFLCILSILRFVTMILFLHDSSPIPNATVFLYVTETITLTVLVSVLNYFKINPLAGIFPRHTFLLVKATMGLLFTGTLMSFVIGCLQLAFNIIGVDDNGGTTSENFRIAFGFLREAVSIVFLHKVVSFLWKKLFNDDEDILLGEENFWEP